MKRWLAGCVLVLGGSGGCSEDTSLDMSERALSTVEHSVTSIDAARVRGSDLQAFNRKKIAYEADPALGSFADGRWTFTSATNTTEFHFEDGDGQSVREPDTARTMTIEARESLGPLDVLGLFGSSGVVDVTSRSVTAAPSSFTPSVQVNEQHDQRLEVEDGGAQGESVTRYSFDGAFDYVDRGEQAVPRYCPQGGASGEVFVSTQVRAEGERRFGEAALTFEVSIDGGYYSWQAFEGSELVGEGEVLSSAGSACGD